MKPCCPTRPVTILRIALLAIFLLCQIRRPVQAQAVSIRFDTLSVEDGLSQSTVRAILQDSQGFLWFGTDDGLNKYDGYSFTLYKHDAANERSIADSAITALYQDNQGNLWVGTASGLDRFLRESDTFQHYQHDPNNSGSLNGSTISAILEDRNTNLWVSTLEGGINRFNPKSGLFDHFIHSANKADSLSSDAVNALAADPRGGLWIGTQAGLDYFDPQSRHFTHYRNNPAIPTSLSSDQVLALFIDRQSILWVGTEEGGLNQFNPGSETFTRYQIKPSNPYSLSSNLVMSIGEDQNGRLWVGGREGLSLLDQKNASFTRYKHDPNDPHSLSNNYILTIFKDHTGVVWIGTYGGGLTKYAQSHERFTLYQHRPNVPTSLSNDIVYAIHEDHAGVVWVGTMDGGLNRLNPETGSFVAYQNNPLDSGAISSNDIRAILEDHKARLWVGTYGGGLNLFDPNNNRFIHYMHNMSNPDSLSDNLVMAIAEDRRGNLWIGTRSGGLELMDPATGLFIHFRYDANDASSLSGDFVHTIYEDHFGRLWIGTNSGISVMDPDTHRFTRYQNAPNDPHSLSDNRVLSILETTDGSVWVGTLMGGLNRFDRQNGTFQHYTQNQGLPSDTIYGILADNQGTLWLSTNRGISHFDSQARTFRTYDKLDGLQSYEFNAGAFFKNKNGRMYFGGIQGYNAFNPEQIKDNPLPPQVVITAFKKFNLTQKIDLTQGEKIDLSYQDNFISFEFASLDYGAPEKNQYAYKLEGFDKDWISAGTRRYASYTNLRAGNYIFRVMGSNQDGVWNTTGASVEINIIPPVWQRWWFIGGVAFIVLGGIGLGNWMRLKRNQAQTRYLEEQIHERTQEIERRREVAEGLREILAILNSNRSLEESLDAIIHQVVRLTEAHVGMIFRYGEDGQVKTMASNLHAKNSKIDEQPMPSWITGPVQSGKEVAISNLAEEYPPGSDQPSNPFANYAALLAVPLLINGQVEGGLILIYDWTRVFSKEDFKMAASFVDHAALAIANAELRSQAEEIAVSAERSRLARDLHDAVTQTLFATSLIAEVLPKLWERNPEMGRQKINEIRELTRGALAEMRTLLMELRPTALIDVPLPDLLQQLCEAFSGRARVPVSLDAVKSIELPTNVKIGFYRITQEALNNIQKHARATQVEIRVCDQGEQVELSIHDNGSGFDPGKTPPDHFGLKIMGERAASFGAQYRLDSQPGKGTQITVTWKKE